MNNNNWIMAQDWHHVLFFHYQIPSDILQALTPFPLDLYQGSAIVSVVPFKMDSIKFPYLPSIGGLSSLWELNLRTYVEVNGIKGVYFFTLDTDSVLGEYIARRFFHLPYNLAQISAEVTETRYVLNHTRGRLKLKVEATIGTNEIKGDFDRWATERYSLFTTNKNSIYQGKVHHEPWKLQEAKLTTLEDGFTNLLNLPLRGEVQSASYSRLLKVKFSRFQKIGMLHDKLR